MNIALVLSGGEGTRMGAELPKQYCTIAGKPVIVHTLEQFEQFDEVSTVIIVASPEWEARIWEWKAAYFISKVQAVASAGSNRQLSIRNGLLAAESFMKGRQGGVIVQDAARPLTSQELLTRLIQGLQAAPAVMPVLPVTDTTYTSRDGEWVDGLLDRNLLFSGQAPEAFHYQPYLELYRQASAEAFAATSGSCQLPYNKGWNVKNNPGDPGNLKITYPGDLEICERKLLERKRPV